MIHISTLFESFCQKITSGGWQYIKHEVIDQPLTTVIFMSLVAFVQILRIINRKLFQHQSNTLNERQYSFEQNQVPNEGLECNKQIASPLIGSIKSEANQQFPDSLQKQQLMKRQYARQLKQEKTETGGKKMLIQQFKRQQQQAKSKQLSDAKRLMLQQKTKKMTDQRNELICMKIKDRISKLFKSKKEKTKLEIAVGQNNHTIKQHALIEGAIKSHNTKQRQIGQQKLSLIIQPAKTLILFPKFAPTVENNKQNTKQIKGLFSNITTSCFKRQSPQKKIQIQISLKEQPKKSPPVNMAIVKNQIVNQEQFLEAIIKFAAGVQSTTEITTAMSNLGGARSNLSNLLIFSKSFISTINLSNDNQVTTFAIKIYNSVVFTLIHNSNLRDGVERIPPKSKSSQVEKNSINCYILIINIYRLMGLQKIWLIVFGKLLKLLEFTYKRTKSLKSHEELQLIVNGYIEKKGEIASRYLSRLDYLTYLLLGLTAFDPILIWNLNLKNDSQTIKSREEILSWKRIWQYKEFWILVNSLFKNKNEFYFKPIIFMNILTVLYPRIYRNKLNDQLFTHQMLLYKVILNKAKQFFERYKTNQEIQALSKSVMRPYEYDGQDFKEGIKVLQNRIMMEKSNEIKLIACDFEAKANIFYYFVKEK